MITDPRYFPSVLQVVPGKAFDLYVYFDDGSLRHVDVEPLLSGEAFRPIRDPDLFRRAITVLSGTVAWDLTGKRDEQDVLDLDALAIYHDLPPVEEPAWVRAVGASEAAERAP
jgi:hypothetical protein